MGTRPFPHMLCLELGFSSHSHSEPKQISFQHHLDLLTPASAICEGNDLVAAISVGACHGGSPVCMFETLIGVNLPKCPEENPLNLRDNALSKTHTPFRKLRRTSEIGDSERPAATTTSERPSQR
ncbi:unnamed protein product [Camellia sinensis]